MAKLEEVLADTFIVERRLPCPSGLHRRFEVRSKSGDSGNTCVLSCAQYATPLNEDALKRQRDLGEKLRTPPFAALCGMMEASFEPEYHWMTSQLPALGSVHEHLREHRKLAVDDVEWLMRVLASALSAAVGKGWPRFRLDAHEIRVDVKARAAGVLLPDMPLFGVAASTAIVDPLQTMAFHPAALGPAEDPVPASSTEYVTPLALLCCEMLGEEVDGGSGGNERFRPIAALSAQQNRVLRAALVGQDRHGFESVMQFASEFTGIDMTDEPAAFVETRRATQPVTADRAPEVQPGLLEGYTTPSEITSIGPCRVWTARHATLGDVVISSVDLSTEVAETTRRLQSMAASLRSANGKHLVIPVDTPGNARELHLIRKKPDSTLLDMLRSSQALEKPAVARMLASIHSAYESLWGLCGRRIVAMSLDQFWLVRGEADEAPAATLRLDATQILLDHEFQPQAAMRPIEHFARLTLHLLGHDGGALSGAGGVRFSPVPELDSATNELIRNALDPSRTGETSLNAFLAGVTAALAGHTAIAQIKQGRVLRLSPKFAGREPVPLARVRLMPDVKEGPILTIVTGGEVLMGRSGNQADFVTQFVPRSPLNDSRTRSISRVQLKAVSKGGQILLEDVTDGNPSMIDSQRLGKPEAVTLPVSVLLACEYPVALRSCRSSQPPGGLKVEGWPEAARRTATTKGACLVVPESAGVLRMELGWLFTDIGIAVSRTQNVLRFCAADDAACVARIHLHAASLWLEALSDEVVVRVANVEIRHGEFVALRPDDVIGVQDRKLLVKEYQIEPA